MILVDINLLLYATFDHAEQHRAAQEWLDTQLNGSHRVGLPWHSLLGFLRIATNPRGVANPMRMSDALQQIRNWLDCEPTWIPEPTERHVDVLGGLLTEAGMHGNLVSDAHLAALAIEHGLTLCSTDGDFARFSNLKWQNPLVQ